MSLDLEKLLDIRQPSDAQLSPDGSKIAYVLGASNKADKDSPHLKSIHLLDLESGSTRAITGTDTWTNESPRWSAMVNVSHSFLTGSIRKICRCM